MFNLKCGNLDVTMIPNVGLFMSYEQISVVSGSTVEEVELDMVEMWGDGVSQFTVYSDQPMVSLPVVIQYLSNKLVK